MTNEEKLILKMESILLSNNKTQLTSWEFDYCNSLSNLYRKRKQLSIKQKNLLFNILKRFE